MKHSFRILISASALLLSACVSHGVMVTEQQVSQIRRGETSEAEVVAILGQPTSISSINGRRMLIYSGMYAQPRPATFIPVVGPLVGGADVRASSVVISISDGIVSDIYSTHTASASGTGLAAGAPIQQVPDQPRK
ncbi:MAG: outer membrane protein assembly factor BamE [Dechloromonas sp.]|nr:outer membrane protein assembly factor BamE [Dechloromonas sp.]